MNFASILLLSVGLAMDATAVAAARGLAAQRVTARHAALVAIFFGGAQALMPLAGALLGRWIGPFLAAWDHWIAAVLLWAVGGKMLWEARSAGDDEAPTDQDLFGLRVMALLAIATSIDAFAVGITLPMMHAPMPLTLTTIGVTTGVLSALGLFAGRRFGAMLGQRLDAFGGLVLVGLGVKFLVDHVRGG